MQFGHDQHERSSRRPYRPPPNYFSRGMQLHILVYVFMFMTVLALMFEAQASQLAMDVATGPPFDPLHRRRRN